MTLRQILNVLWKGKWIIVVVTLAALITAFIYLQVRAETFVSTSVIRLNSVVSDGAYTGEIGGVAVDVGPEAVRSPEVIDPAAEAIGESSGALSASIDVDVDDSGALARMYITATGDSPEQAQERAAAVQASYVTYVDAQLQNTLTTLQQRQAEAIQAARELQQQAAESPGDAIAATNLAAALSKMTTLNATIEEVNDSGPATAIVRNPPLGTSTVPSQLIVLLLALATGLIVGIAAALIRDQFDNRLRGEDEIEQISGARSLGELSWDRSVGQMTPPLPVARNERTDLSERLRTLRSTLQVFLPSRTAVMVITSVEPGDGKSFVSANLAMAWARTGKTVILVGGDLRRPDLARYFDEAALGEGMSEILESHDIDEPLQIDEVEVRLNPTKYRRLRILPAGVEPPDPADLLAKPVLAELIQYLRAQADVVIIDSPPAIGMTDAALLALQSDGAVIISSVRKTDRVLLAETVAALKAAGAAVIGVVANRSRRRLPKTYSSYYISPRTEQLPRAVETDGDSSRTVADLRRLLGADRGASAPAEPDAQPAKSRAERPRSDLTRAEETRADVAEADDDDDFEPEVEVQLTVDPEVQEHTRETRRTGAGEH